MAITYNIEVIENFQDDDATVAALDAIGADDWELVQIEYSPQSDGTTTATCIFKK